MGKKHIKDTKSIMTNKHFIITFISLFLAVSSIFGQDLSELGRLSVFSFDQFHRKQIIDKETSLPIAFANVGVVERHLGTVGDENGFFRLRIADEYHDGILRISYIGFETLDIPVAQFVTMTDEQIALRRRETRIERPEPPTRYRTRVLGNRRPPLLMTVPMPNRGNGGEGGVLLPIKRRTHLTEFNLPIAGVTTDSVFFRLNFHKQVDRIGFATILNEPIYVRQKIDRNAHYISFDLRPYNLVVTENTLVTIEDIKQQAGEVLIILRMRGRRTITRDVSHTYFGQFPIFTFAMFVTANVER